MPSGTVAGEPSEPDGDGADLLAGLPSAIVEPLLEVRPAYLDTDRLHTSEDFELLMAQIAAEVHGLSHVKFYGTRGQRQHGIDLVGVARDNTIWSIQAKRHRTFGPADLRDAFAKFANADRQANGDRLMQISTLVIAVACEARGTPVVETFFALRDEAAAADRPFNLHFWDRQDLSEQMRATPQIVRRFFGPYTASRFCDQDAEPGRGGLHQPGFAKASFDGAEQEPTSAALRSPTLLADIVMVGPERASGADTVLNRARQTLVTDPARAVELFQEAEALLSAHGFLLQAAIVAEAKADALVGSGQYEAAAEVLVTRFWSALDAGSQFDCRRIEHDLDKLAQRTDSGPQVASAAGAVHAASRILKEPVSGLAMVERVLCESPSPLGAAQLARLASETAAAAGRWSWLAANAAALQAAAAYAGTVALADDGLRIAMCLADATDLWDTLLDRAQTAEEPMRAAVIQARYARRCAYRQEPTTARQMWMAAAATAAEHGRNNDASEWLFAVSKLRHRFSPLDSSEDEARNSARALRAGGSATPIYSRYENGREAGLDASQAGRGTEAIDRLQDYLRSSLAAGRWVDEDDARTLLAPSLIKAGRLDEAARHLVVAGNVTFDELLDAAGDQYLDVTGVLQEMTTAAYWQRAAALRLLERQADLVPDEQAQKVIEFALDAVSAAMRGVLVDNHPMFAPSLYLSSHAVLASLADAMTVSQAERLLELLLPLVPREPDHYRHSDEAHIRSCVTIARHYPTLRPEALDQLLSLIETADSSIALHIRRHARTVLADHLALVRDRLERAAADGNGEAIELLADIDHENDQSNLVRVDAAHAALGRLTEPVKHVPGVYSVGTNAPMDAVVARILPQEQLSEALSAQLVRASDARSPLSNRADYLAAAFNLALKLTDQQASGFFTAAAELTHNSGRSEDPLAEFGMPATDLRVNAALLCAALARTPERKREALRISLRQLTQTDNAGNTVTHMLQIIDPPDLQTYLPLLASRPEWTLRAYAGSKWTDGSNRDPDLGKALAIDKDARVQHALARALARTQPAEADESVREAVAASPYRSVRRALSAQV